MMAPPSVRAGGLERKLRQLFEAPTLDGLREATEAGMQQAFAGLEGCPRAFSVGQVLMGQAHLLAACVHLTLRRDRVSARAGAASHPPRVVAVLGVSLLESIHCLHWHSFQLLASACRQLPPAAPVTAGATVGASALAAVAALAVEVVGRYYYTGLDVALAVFLAGVRTKDDRRFGRLAQDWREACPALHGRLPDTMDTKRVAALLTAESRLVTPCADPRFFAAPGGARRGSARKRAARPRGPGGVRLGNSWEEPALVRGRAKALRSYRELKVLRALQEAGAEGLKKDALESVASDARRILRRLIEDADWCAVIRMPRKKGNRYRLLTEQ